MSSATATLLLPPMNALCIFLAICGSSYAARAQELPANKPGVQESGTTIAGMGRLYFFRPIRSFGANIGDYVTVNGVPVYLITPGKGFYCDVSPGRYVVGVARHKTYQLKVSVAAGELRYVCVMLHHQGGASPRAGALTSDQSFEVRLLEPDYGARRVHEYPLARANCRP